MLWFYDVYDAISAFMDKGGFRSVVDCRAATDTMVADS